VYFFYDLLGFMAYQMKNCWLPLTQLASLLTEIWLACMVGILRLQSRQWPILLTIISALVMLQNHCNLLLFLASLLLNEKIFLGILEKSSKFLHLFDKLFDPTIWGKI
jgi:hypothetical protein